MQSRWLILMALCVCSFTANSQNQLNTEVSFNYRDVSLGYALDDLSTRYALSFSYSKDFIPVGKKVTANAKNEPLSQGLETLLSNTKVVYNPIGDYIVLRSDPNKKINVGEEKNRIGKIQEKPNVIIRPARPMESEVSYETEVLTTSYEAPILTTSIEPEIYTAPSPQPEQRKNDPTQPLRKQKIQQIKEESEREEITRSLEKVEFQEKKSPVKNGENFNAQISLVPKVGTNHRNSDTITNNLSINLISGKNGGVQGVEVGAIYNQIEQDVSGAQISGFINHVKGDVKGMAKENDKENFKPGLQVAGFANVSTNVEGMQIAGVANIAKGDVEGGQISVFYNGVGGNARGAQVVGFLNSNRGDASVQVSLIANRARDVAKVQIAPIFNKARVVKGLQIGLINVSDTIEGVSIGLFNITKRGYNRIELSTSEVFHAKVAYKFGGDRFYNILQFGKAFRINTTDSYRPEAWALGYGLGTSWKSGKNKKTRTNIEIIASYLSETNPEVYPGSVFGEIKLTRSVILKKKFELFFGPTFNLIYSTINNTTLSESEIGTKLLPYHLASINEVSFRQTSNGIQQITTGNTKLWVGFSTGIRF